MGTRIIVDYYGEIVRRNPDKDKNFGILYSKKFHQHLGLKFFKTEASREKFINKADNSFTFLLEVDL